jgi:hypothetical protein
MGQMGVFDFFLSDEKKIQRYQRSLTDKAQQAEEREAAARWLAQNGTPVALLALLSRFEMRLEHQLKDTDEKEAVYDQLVRIGKPVVEPLRVHLKNGRQVSIPLRLLVELDGIDAAVALVLDLLEHERKKDDFKPDKKRQLLVWLAEGRHLRGAPVAAAFVSDFDEGVRYAAVEVLIAAADEPARSVLEKVLADPKEESTRVRTRVADIFASRAWKLEDPDAVAAHLPPGFVLRNGRVAAAER